MFFLETLLHFFYQVNGQTRKRHPSWKSITTAYGLLQRRKRLENESFLFNVGIFGRERQERGRRGWIRKKEVEEGAYRLSNERNTEISYSKHCQYIDYRLFGLVIKFNKKEIL